MELTGKNIKKEMEGTNANNIYFNTSFGGKLS